MTYLLDVNLLIALIDSNHVHYHAAHDWLAQLGSDQWATCPLTENGFLRIMGSPTYPNRPGSSPAVLEFLQEFCSRPEHRFWPDSLSIRTLKLTHPKTALPSRHVTDLYLLSLATHHRGKLATFDRRIPAGLISKGEESVFVLE